MSTAAATYRKRKRTNGCMYEPAQDPTSQQGFNRYAYCLYNPLKYVDPSGERAFGPSWVDLVRMCDDWVMEQKRAAFQMGLTMVESHLEEATRFASLLFYNWGDGGSSGSGNSGGGSGVARKNENGEMIPDENKPTFSEWLSDKCSKKMSDSNPIPEEYRNADFVRDFINTYFPGAPIDNIDNIIVECNSNGYFAKARPGSNGDFFSGQSDLYYSWNAFDDMYEFYYATGHELIHVSQFAEMSNMDGVMFEYMHNDAFIAMLDIQAYNFNSMMGQNSYQNFGGYYQEIKENNYFNVNQSHISYYHFDWAKNPLYIIKP